MTAVTCNPVPERAGQLQNLRSDLG